MKCSDALAALQSAQDEFALRYYRWSLRQSERELTENFPLVRQAADSVGFRFLDFAEGLPKSEVRSFMVFGIKRFNPCGAELAGEPVSKEEENAHQKYLAYLTPEVALFGKQLSSMRVSPRTLEIRNRELLGKPLYVWTNVSSSS
jgi:hypothetical protein